MTSSCRYNGLVDVVRTKLHLFGYAFEAQHLAFHLYVQHQTVGWAEQVFDFSVTARSRSIVVGIHKLLVQGNLSYLPPLFPVLNTTDFFNGY